MNRSKNNEKTIEDQLANFTDNILNEKTPINDEAPFSTDPELQVLEQTALRLKNAFRNDDLSEEVIQRMRNNIALQWRQESKEWESFWKNLLVFFKPAKQKWQPQRIRQRWSIIAYAVVALGLFLVSIYLLDGTYSDQPAASGQNLIAGFIVLAFGVIGAIVWFIRRKR